MNNFTMFAVSIIITSMLAGCDGWQSIKDIRIDNYKCNPEQLEAVEKEYRLCTETGYLDSYCFASAKKTLCDHVSESK